ncbi:hypothetical protein [Lysobacter enzymogenes]|uniref:hypothetical protein n=1 Tax=Lysobacter enzymogenes TaxID=69 RepID=UPI00089A8440|nr:hypothetical protein [Lysobacter enzymogenes]SDX53026.1 hypothetical protein SAMN05421681_10634 [Lysobacter enzymogenes]
MAGPWEKYQQAAAAAAVSAPTDTPAEGPWTRYQQPAADFSDVHAGVSSTDHASPSVDRYAAAGINPNINPADGESFLDNVAAGFGSSYVDLKNSARQLLVNNAARHTGALRELQEQVGAIEPAKRLIQGADNAAQSYRKGVQAEIDEKKRNDESLRGTGGGFTGNALGLLSQVLLPASGLRVAAAGPGAASSGVNGLLLGAARALMPATIKGSAAQGLVLGALQPVASDDSRGVDTLIGGLAGGAGATLGKGIGAAASAAYQGTRNLLAPTVANIEQRVAQVLRQEAANPGLLLSGQPSPIPGVQRTLAEETLDPGIARLERLLRSKGGTWGDLDRANNDARVSVIQQFAGDRAAIESAKRQRSAAAKPLLDQALQVTGVDINAAVKTLKDAARGAEGRPAVQEGLARVASLLKRAAPGGQGTVAEDRLSVLYNVRKTIDDMLAGKYGGESAAALAGSRELMGVKESLDDVMIAASPEFGQYLDAFRKGSIPIGRMQIGRELLEKGGAVPDAVSGNIVLTPAQFSKATRDMDRVAAKATGFKKAEADRYLQPADEASIAGIQDDLQRRAFAASAGSGGNSQTAERLLGNERLTKGVTGRVASRIPLFGAASEYLREAGQQRLESKLAEVLMNPKQAKSILTRLPPNDRRALQAALTRAGNYVGAVSANANE